MLSQAEIRSQITQKIIESLKQGKIPWRKPWTGVDGPRTPTNFLTKRPYSGINIPILWLQGQEKGYGVDYWASFQQWKSAGASVKKGEKATQIIKKVFQALGHFVHRTPDRGARASKAVVVPISDAPLGHRTGQHVAPSEWRRDDIDLR